MGWWGPVCVCAMCSMRVLLGFATQFRMDSPLVNFGSVPYQPDEPINTGELGFTCGGKRQPGVVPHALREVCTGPWRLWRPLQAPVIITPLSQAHTFVRAVHFWPPS